MFVEQAIFTSVRNGRNEGYQLAATSPGVTLAVHHELTQWGPAHDSLYDTHAAAESTNFHPLESGCYCLSHTQCAGREYSGRGGFKIHTRSCVIPPVLLERFGNQPFRIMQALVAAGRVAVLDPVPDQLDAIPLVGRASAVRTEEVQRTCEMVGAERLASLLCALLKSTTLGIVSPFPATRLMSCVFDLLPVSFRPQFSFTTGLKVSPRRPFRVAMLPDNRDEQRQAARLIHMAQLDLQHDSPGKFAAQSGWPLLVYELLRSRQFGELAALVQSTAHTPETNADLMAEHGRHQIDQHNESQRVVTPLTSGAP